MRLSAESLRETTRFDCYHHNECPLSVVITHTDMASRHPRVSTGSPKGALSSFLITDIRESNPDRV